MLRFLLCALCGMASVWLCAQDTPVLPPLPDMSDDDVSEDSENAATNVTEKVSYDFTWDVDAYSSLNWASWDSDVEYWFQSLGYIGDACIYPPTPPETFFGIGQALQELPSVFNTITNDVPAVLVEGVPTWGVNVREKVNDTTGKRQFITIIGHHIVHASPVPSTFDPETWCLKVYNNGNPLPDWINNDEEARTTWFSLRGRERLGMSYTFVAPGRIGELQRALQLKADEERLKDEAPEKPPRDFSFTKIDFPNPMQILFGFYNPKYVALGLFTQKHLGDKWDYRGQIPASIGHDYVEFSFNHLPENDPTFFKIVDLTTDTDKDGLPDGMEVAFFKTDPNSRDTTDCGMDDWSKIYLYDLDPTIPDNDHDGILDGEDELPTIAGPEITIQSPREGEAFTVSSIGTANVVTSCNIMPAHTVASDSPKLVGLWINGVNKITYDNPLSFLGGHHEIVSNEFTPGKHSIVVEAEQEGEPRLRSRKFIEITVKARGPALHVIEPEDGTTIYQTNIAVKVRVEDKNVVVLCNGQEMQQNNYYRFIVLQFAEADVGKEKSITLQATTPTGEITTKRILITVGNKHTNQIPTDHILNLGLRVFEGHLDGVTVSPDDFNEEGVLAR